MLRIARVSRRITHDGSQKNKSVGGRRYGIPSSFIVCIIAHQFVIFRQQYLLLARGKQRVTPYSKLRDEDHDSSEPDFTTISSACTVSL